MRMTMTLRIREGVAGDAPVIARLSIRECRRHIRPDCSEAGFRLLLAGLVARAVEARMDDSNFHYWVATGDDAVCGVCVLRETTHLYHLFVESEWQGRGIARRLWEAARDDVLTRSPLPRTFTVNASTFARPVYAKLGFRMSGEALSRNGIRSWPMSLQLS